MTRTYDEPVDVRRREDIPAQFLWRGRLYVVRDVLAHWVETGAWWSAPASRSVFGTEDAPSLAQEQPAEGSGPAEAEREVWRVEAGAGRGGGSGIYDLCFDWAAGAWTLVRVLD